MAEEKKRQQILAFLKEHYIGKLKTTSLTFKKTAIYLLIILQCIITGCGIYTFTGATIPVNTITINFFENQSNLINPSLSQTFTETLKDRFISQSKLNLVDINGEWYIDGKITSYIVSPIAASATQASLNRLTINILVNFEDRTNSANKWNQNFSRYADFDATKSLNEVEESLVEDINEQLVNDIFNKVALNW
jgi:hypothetical protein